MTKSPGWVQNKGPYRAAGGEAATRRPKLRVERRPFLAPEAVIFGVDFTGPYILVVILHLVWRILKCFWPSFCTSFPNPPIHLYNNSFQVFRRALEKA
jgi:hypothetical protein